jgi:hypothetical protein
MKWEVLGLFLSLLNITLHFGFDFDLIIRVILQIPLMAKSAPNKTAKGRGKLPKPTRRPSPSAFQDAAEKLNAMNQAPGQTSGRPRASSSDALLVGVNGNASLAPDRTFLEYASAAPQCK